MAPKNLPRVLGMEAVATFPLSFALSIKKKTRKKTFSLKWLDINTQCHERLILNRH